MKFTTYISLGIFGLMQFQSIAQGQLSKPLKVRSQFTLPTSITTKDYVQKTVVFKLKPQYRNVASVNKITNPLLDQVLLYVGLNSLNKKFPKHSAPEKQRNELGQAYADLSLIYELKYTNNINIEDAINQLLSKLDFEPNILSIKKRFYITKKNYKNLI